MNQININVNNQTEFDHVQMNGQAIYDRNKTSISKDESKEVVTFMFTPDEHQQGCVQPFRGSGTGQQMSDGSFEFVLTPRKRSESTLILKLPHGRLSETKDGAIQLTLKVFNSENADIRKIFIEEAKLASLAVVD